MRLTTTLTYQEALVRGIEPGTITIEIDPATLTQGEREALAAILRDDYYRDCPEGYICSGRMHGLPLDQSGVSAISKTRADETAKAATEKAAKEAARQQKREAALADLRSRTPADLAENFFICKPAFFDRPPQIRSTAAIPGGYDLDLTIESLGEPLASQVRAEIDRLVREYEVGEAKFKAEKESRERARVAALKTWAGAHGSELLQARIDGGFAWESLARKEYSNNTLAPLADTIPGLEAVSDGEGDANPRTSPTLAEIRVLRMAQKAIPGVEFSLDWVTYESEDAEKYSRTELRAVVTAPDESTVTRFFAVEGAEDTRNR